MVQKARSVSELNLDVDMSRIFTKLNLKCNDGLGSMMDRYSPIKLMLNIRYTITHTNTHKLYGVYIGVQANDLVLVV